MEKIEAEEAALYVHVRQVSDELDDPEDANVAGLYAVTFIFETAGFTKAKLASIALDSFHAHQGIGSLEDFEINVVDENGKCVEEDANHENGSCPDDADVEKVHSPEMMAKFWRASLPPDPEGKNDERADSAAIALSAFINETETDRKDAVADMLCDLMHWCDRNGFNFSAELRRAQQHYKEETLSPETESPAP